MHHAYRFLALVALLVCVSKVSAQSDTFTFEDNTDDGFGLKFSNDASANFQIVTDAAPGNGTKYMRVPRTGAFQEADRGSGDATFVAAMQAAMANPSGYDISYD